MNNQSYKIITVKRQWKSNREIAKLLGVSEATIRRRLKELEK
ncbi:AsnC family protein [Lysinibacillus sp. FSL H8-0500]